MKIAIAFSGPAWTWPNTAWLFLGEILSQKGYHVYADKQYASVIKWDNNIFILYISDKDFFITDELDYFFTFDDFGTNKNIKTYKLPNIIKIESSIKFKNTFSFGAALKVLWISIEEWKQVMQKKFKEEIFESNLENLNQWYDSIETKFDLSKIVGNPRTLIMWNEIIALWWIASGLDFYSAYPMTPASSIADEVLKHKEVKFFQWEDEIAVAMSMLGAKFAGKRAMCGTSWWGFALMTESISFSNQAELGGVYVLSQRAWPSTGTPTFTEQADLNYALNATFGDTFPIVIAPSDYEDVYNLIWKALNYSDIYQYPVIFVVDKSFSESYLSVDTTMLNAEKINRWKLESSPVEDFARYSITDDGISPYTIPGTANGEYITTSYEHNEYGVSIDDADTKVKMTEKRFKKLETFVKNEFNDDFFGYEIINPDAKIFYITFGINKIVLKDFVADNPDMWVIIIKVLQPIDIRLQEFLNKSNIQKLIFVEMNYSWQLKEYITAKLWLTTPQWKDKIQSINKFSLYPLYPKDLWEKS